MHCNQRRTHLHSIVDTELKCLFPGKGWSALESNHPVNRDCVQTKARYLPLDDVGVAGKIDSQRSLQPRRRDKCCAPSSLGGSSGLLPRCFKSGRGARRSSRSALPNMYRYRAEEPSKLRKRVVALPSDKIRSLESPELKRKLRIFDRRWNKHSSLSAFRCLVGIAIHCRPIPAGSSRRLCAIPMHSRPPAV